MNKKWFYIFLVLFISIVFNACNVDVESESAKARSKKYRSVTVINNTDELLIKECILSTKSGVQITHKDNQKDRNIIFINFDPKKVYENEKDFTIILVDRFGLQYSKTFTANEKGNTDIIITRDDYKEHFGDFVKKINKAMNK